MKDLAGLVRGSRDDVADKVREQLERMRQMEREIRTLKDQLASGQGAGSGRRRGRRQGVKVVATKVDGADAGALRNAVDQLKERLKSAVIVLASVESPTKVVLVAGVTADQTQRIKAGELVGRGGRTGRRPRRRPGGFCAGRRQQARGARCRAGLGRGIRAHAAERLRTSLLCRPCRP